MGLVALTIGLAIAGMESMGKEVTLDMSGWFFWNKSINFRRYYTAEAGSQVLSSFG